MPYRVDARMAGRHPFELFTLYLAFVIALPTVLGLLPEPGSIRELLPAWMSWGWSLILMAGAGTALAGVYWKDRVTGLILEQLGLAGTGLGTGIYTIAVLSVFNQEGLFSAALCAGFVVACGRRYFQIQETLNAAHAVQVLRERGEA